MCGSDVTVVAAFKTADIDPISLSPTVPRLCRPWPASMFSTLPSHSVDASPRTWYHASYTGLPVSHSNSPQSSNGSLICTPYQGGGHITDIGCSENSFGYALRDTCPTGSTKPVVGLGLHAPEPPKSSPLRLSSEPAPEMLSGFGTIPFSIEYVQGPRNCDTRWQDADAGFPRVSDSHYNGVFTETPYPHQASRAHSTSNGGAGTSISPLLFLPELESLGDHRTGNVRSMVRSFSQPPGSYAHPSHECWARPVADYPARGSQWASLTEDYKSDSPIPRNDSEKSPLFQSRVGSDRTRAISSSRRSNPDKKLFHCPFAGCGATLTSRHNFKSHKNSHFGIKPHACGQGQCNKRFGTTAEVKRHRANHCQYKS